jgi:hypothetical protein
MFWVIILEKNYLYKITAGVISVSFNFYLIHPIISDDFNF